MSNRLALRLVLVGFVVVSAIVAARSRQNSGDSHAERGIEAFKARDYKRAAEEFEHAVEGRVTRYKLDAIYAALGDAYSELDEFDKARTAYDRALELNEDCAQAWVGHGVVHRLLSEYDDARKCYDKALAIDPDNAEARSSLGVLLMATNRAEEAIPELEAAVRLDPAYAAAHANLAVGYAMVGRFDEAEESLRKAAEHGYPAERCRIVRDRIDELKRSR